MKVEWFNGRTVRVLCAGLTVWCCTLWLLGCSGTIGDTLLEPASYQPELVEAPLELAATAGFADERGGGMFADAEGRVVRLRSDGSMARIEAHPGNRRPPGKALRMYPAGPFSALVVAEGGLYFADGGWLIEPAWSAELDAQGIVAVAVGSNGATWVAHQRGLFYSEAGQLSELKVAGASLSNISALAAAPTPDGAPGVWFVQGDVLSYAGQTARTTYEVREHARAEKAFLGPIRALASLSAAPGRSGELWLATDRALYQRVGGGWVRHAASDSPTALAGAGRFLWLHAGVDVFRYDADERKWARVEGLPAAASLLLGAEAGGSAWLRIGEKSFALSPGPLPRLLGLFEGMRVYGADVLVQAQFPALAAPTMVRFAIDDLESSTVEQKREDAQPGEGAVATLNYAWGGVDGAGVARTHSLAGLSDGLHTLTVTAKYDGRELARRVHFEFRGGAVAAISFARDVQPIMQARCAKCHSSGPGHALATYDQWVAEKGKIVSAVVEQRMPADGPLDPAQLEIIQRWAAGGTKP